MTIKSKIRTVPIYSKHGIMFKVIVTLLNYSLGFKLLADRLVSHCKDIKINKIAVIKSRGFILGAPFANPLNVGFVPLKKKVNFQEK